MGISQAIETIYDEREKFLLIGLTGRTGSGCTMVSKILSTEKFDDLALHDPQTTDFNTAEERKYQIIYNYAQKHWSKFFRISMTDIIFSFVIQESYNDFMNEISIILNKEIAEKIKSKIDNNYPELDSEYKYLNTKISGVLDENNRLNRNGDQQKTIYDILVRLPSIQSKFREIMNQYIFYDEKSERNVNTFTFCLQVFGDRIRHHGSITNDSVFSGNHMFSIARRANDFIKAVRHQNSNANSPTFICLDAIRNPYEATYFQDRYSSFYLVAVSTDDSERIRRLGESMNREQIKALDEKEYPRKLKDFQKFTNQDIGACMQLADIYLYNPYESTIEKYFITESIVKYITLMKHPGLITPTSIERCMQIAYNAKLNSGCLSRQIGAVITDSNYSIKAVGWNSVAEGQVPCNLRNVENYIVNKDESSFSEYEINDFDFCKHINEKYKPKIKINALKVGTSKWRCVITL